MPKLLLTPLQQQAIKEFANNVDETGDYGTATLASEVRQRLHGGDWLLFTEQLAMTSNAVHNNVEKFLLAVCGSSLETITDKMNKGECAFTYIEKEIDSDDACPFRETSDYLLDFAELDERSQQGVTDVLKTALPGLNLSQLFVQTLLPAIMVQHEKRALLK